MPKKGIQKSIQVYLSKIRKPAVSDHHDPVDHRDIPHAGSAAAGWLLSACKHPRTPSFAGDDRGRKEGGGHPPQDEAAATLKDIDKFLFENFRSLYVNKDDPRRRKDGDDDDVNNEDAVLLCESPTFVKTPPSLRASHRFFVSTSLDNTLLERPSTEASTAGDPRSSSSSSSGSALPGDSLAVVTYSRRPYDDFRRSMQEMVEARRELVVRPSPAGRGQSLDWDFMEELLFCYLRLNDKRAHKYILRAFVDLVVSFRPAKAPPAAASRPRRNKKAAPGERISRRRRRNADSSSDERDS